MATFVDESGEKHDAIELSDHLIYVNSQGQVVAAPKPPPEDSGDEN